MDMERLILSRGLTKKQLHAKSAKAGTVVAVCLAVVSGVDFAPSHLWMHRLFGVAFGVLALLNAGLALAQYRLSRKSDTGAA